jgi:hypothetical protein
MFSILAAIVILGSMTYVPSVTNYVNTKTDGSVFSFEIDYKEVAMSTLNYNVQISSIGQLTGKLSINYPNYPNLNTKVNVVTGNNSITVYKGLGFTLSLDPVNIPNTKTFY